MTRHDFEAWLDHHLDQPVLVEWRELDGGLVMDKTSTTGALRKDGDGEYHAGDAHIDLGDFEAADFGGDGVVVEFAQENAELYIAPASHSPHWGSSPSSRMSVESPTSMC